jgi:uncharacterized membrane protein YfcA
MVFVLFVCALIAFSLSAVCGGGAGLLLMPLLGQVLPVTEVPAALSIGTVASSASRIAIFYRSIRWDIVRRFVPSALPAVFLGAWLLKFINPVYLEIGMGIFLIGNLPAMFSKKKTEYHTTNGSYGALVLIGFLAGFLSGLTGAVGLLFNRFYLKYGLTKEQIVATRAANEIILHIIKLILYASFGLMTLAVIKFGIAVAIAGLLSSRLMKWVLKWISEFVFRKIGYGAMVLSGIMMLAQSTSTVFAQNNAYLTFHPMTGGVESKVQWQNSNLAVEFEYDEGFEYEAEIAFVDLPIEKQLHVLSKKGDASRIVIEKVYAIGSISYEAYYYNKSGLIDKIDFD